MTQISYDQYRSTSWKLRTFDEYVRTQIKAHKEMKMGWRGIALQTAALLASRHQ